MNSVNEQTLQVRNPGDKPPPIGIFGKTSIAVPQATEQTSVADVPPAAPIQADEPLFNNGIPNPPSPDEPLYPQQPKEDLAGDIDANYEKRVSDQKVTEKMTAKEVKEKVDVQIGILNSIGWLCHHFKNRLVNEFQVNENGEPSLTADMNYRSMITEIEDIYKQFDALKKAYIMTEVHGDLNSSKSTLVDIFKWSKEEAIQSQAEGGELNQEKKHDQSIESFLDSAKFADSSVENFSIIIKLFLHDFNNDVRTRLKAYLSRIETPEDFNKEEENLKVAIQDVLRLLSTYNLENGGGTNELIEVKDLDRAITATSETIKRRYSSLNIIPRREKSDGERNANVLINQQLLISLLNNAFSNIRKAYQVVEQQSVMDDVKQQFIGEEDRIIGTAELIVDYSSPTEVRIIIRDLACGFPEGKLTDTFVEVQGEKVKLATVKEGDSSWKNANKKEVVGGTGVALSQLESMIQKVNGTFQVGNRISEDKTIGSVMAVTLPLVNN